MKKIVTVPADIQLKDPVSGTVGALVSFRQFIREMMLSDTSFVANYDAIKSAAKIDVAFADVQPAAQVALDLPEYDKLVKVAKTPTGGRYVQNTLPMIQLLPFLEAVIGATDQA